MRCGAGTMVCHPRSHMNHPLRPLQPCASLRVQALAGLLAAWAPERSDPSALAWARDLLLARGAPTTGLDPFGLSETQVLALQAVGMPLLPAGSACSGAVSGACWRLGGELVEDASLELPRCHQGILHLPPPARLAACDGISLGPLRRWVAERCGLRLQVSPGVACLVWRDRALFLSTLAVPVGGFVYGPGPERRHCLLLEAGGQSEIVWDSDDLPGGLPSQGKVAWRRELRARRQAISAGHRHAAESACCDAVWQLLQAQPDQACAAYMAIGSELDLGALAERLWQAGRGLWLPRVQAEVGDLVWSEVRAPEQLRRGWRGLREPDPTLPCQPLPPPGLLLVPGLGFSSDGRRLGQGGGFYDRLLARLEAWHLSIGVAFACQLVEDLPCDAHDRPVAQLLLDGRCRPVNNSGSYNRE